MAKTYAGKMIARGKRFGLVVSRFNEFISSRLLEGALDSLKRHGALEGDMEVVWVPGSFEIPAVAQRLALSEKYDAVICLGALIKGDTPHFEYIAAEVTKGIAAISMNVKIPVLYGVITVENLEQAIDRAGTKAGNKGAQAAEAAIEMVSLYSQI